MEIFKYNYLIKCGTNFFSNLGTCEEHSRIISEVLVKSSFCGHDSHGLQRFSEYKKLFDDKKISVNGKITKKIVDNRMFVNGGNNWGIVVANAIHDAVGVRLTEAPMSPVKVLKALNQKNGKNG